MAYLGSASARPQQTEDILGSLNRSLLNFGRSIESTVYKTPSALDLLKNGVIIQILAKLGGKSLRILERGLVDCQGLGEADPFSHFEVKVPRPGILQLRSVVVHQYLAISNGHLIGYGQGGPDCDFVPSITAESYIVFESAVFPGCVIGALPSGQISAPMQTSKAMAAAHFVIKHISSGLNPALPRSVDVNKNEQELRDMRRNLAEVISRMEEKELQLIDMRQQKERIEEQLSALRLEKEAAERILNAKGENDTWKIKRNEIQIIENEESLGVGGWGVVKIAMFRGVKVAAKFMHEEIISPHNIVRFTREMNMAARLRHPNLLLFIGASLDQDKPVLVTELMPNNLRNIIERATLSKVQKILIATDVALGLNYLHLMEPDPIIHRDVSSSNVLLEPIGLDNWRAKVSDYGSVDFVSFEASENPGNVVYAAPETNTKFQTPKMDVYSYGILLHEMVTGRFPDGNKPQLETLSWQQMASLIRHCISRDPANRPHMKHILISLQELDK